jgi:hypothetical protein
MIFHLISVFFCFSGRDIFVKETGVQHLCLPLQTLSGLIVHVNLIWGVYCYFLVNYLLAVDLNVFFKYIQLFLANFFFSNSPFF